VYPKTVRLPLNYAKAENGVPRGERILLAAAINAVGGGGEA